MRFPPTCRPSLSYLPRYAITACILESALSGATCFSIAPCSPLRRTPSTSCIWSEWVAEPPLAKRGSTKQRATPLLRCACIHQDDNTREGAPYLPIPTPLPRVPPFGALAAVLSRCDALQTLMLTCVRMPAADATPRALARRILAHHPPPCLGQRRRPRVARQVGEASFSHAQCPPRQQRACSSSHSSSRHLSFRSRRSSLVLHNRFG